MRGRDESLIESEEKLNSLPVILEGLRTVAEVNGPIELGVGFDWRRWISCGSRFEWMGSG
jgi:hypothetical protein